MRILVVAYYYPPDSAVGAIRPAKIVRALEARGHDVEVIAAAGPTSANTAPNVHRVRPMRHPREFYNSFRRPAHRAAVDAAATASSDGAAVPDRVPAWRRHIFSFLWLPDDRQGFIWPAYRAARALSRRKPFDVIYTSAPPASVHLVGLLFSKATGVRWIAEFRDPWLDGVPKPWHVRSALSDAADRRLERACLKQASDVVTVTYTAAEKINAKRKQLSRSQAHVVLNGIDDIVATTRVPSGPIRAVHVGSLYASRDPRPLLTAIAELRRLDQLNDRGVAIEFIGDARWYGDVSLEEFAKTAGIEDVIRLRDTVPHAEVARILADADLLVLLAQQQPVQVPNKLYEYLGQRKPILAFADDEGETAAMLRRAGQHFVVTERDTGDDATRIVREAFDSAASDEWTPDDEQLQVWRTDRQMATLVSLVET